ncbi:ABC-2 type transporter-domain-containing protein [Biscogniauxia mediterranea]|nr:ABC-2 type transporter-domain-containing protein [Biscogniauxia mediterranea]
MVRTGEMLLVLGRPGSGCSTLLKVLAGDTHGLHIGKGTKINYEGISYDQMHHLFKGESIYLAELDVHFPELTLGETLAFAISTRKDKSNESYSLARKVASMFNLDNPFDTKIGNTVIRGISGGEKRRTSLAEAFISGAGLQCWDNSTRGLDSATAQSFVELLRDPTNSSHSTIIMSIYQASEGIYAKFHKVTLLYEGRQIYFGPTNSASDYFVKLGFLRPARAATADFLTSVTNPDERIIREGFEDRVPRSPEEFESVWKQSTEYRVLLDDIDSFSVTNPLGMVEIDKNDAGRQHRDICTYPIPIYSQVLICIKRGFLRLRNNYPPVLAGIIGNTIIAIVIGSVFYNLGNTTDSLEKRAVLLFFSLMVTAFAPAFEILTMWLQRPVVEKHHRYAFYHPFTEGFASIVCDLPNKLATSIMFHISLYFMTNLRRNTASFFIYYLFNFMVTITMSMLFRMIGSVSKTIEQTMAPVSVVVVILIAYTGFVIPVNYMVPWLSWLRWLNPLAYAYESLMVNEFDDRIFTCSSIVPSGSIYSQSGMDGKACSAIGAVPGESVVHGTAYLYLKYGYERAHLWRNLPIMLGMMIVYCVVHLLAAEYIPAQRSKGEILLFQRRHYDKERFIVENEEIGTQLTFVQDLSQRVVECDKDDSCSKGKNAILNQSVVFHWDGLNYDMKTKSGPHRILNDIDGWVKPGTVTALMGVTGAGKTSLLDALACRSTVGTVTGEIYIGGRLRDASFQRRMGYVQQEDIHLASSTVREALNFSALLRQPKNVPTEEKLAYVDNVLNMLDMESYAEAVVGVPGEGLNVEQRKRLTIAVEMVAKPELLLFLDEPTSGLDSQTAWSICMLLRKLADNGQAILCTIHQPSSQLFQLFDRLLLLSRNGETLYFGDVGPSGSSVVEYFEAHGASACQTDDNPAEWILNVTNNSPNSMKNPESPPIDWSDVWKNSQQKQEVLRELAELKKFESSPHTTSFYHTQYAASLFQQLSIVSKRIFQDYWRDPIYLLSKMALCIGVALANGISFLTTVLDIQGLTNLIFSTFLLSQLFSTIDQQVIPRLVSGRALFEARERRSMSYSWVVFLASNVLVEIFWQTVASALVFALWFYPTGLWDNGDPGFGTIERGALVFMLVWLFCLWIITFSQAVAVSIEHAETAVQIATLFFWLSLVFCGVIVSPNDLPQFWRFVYHASPLTYFITGVIVAGLANTRIACSAVELLHINPPSSDTTPQTCGEYLGPYARFSGGYVANPDARTDCMYCPASSTNAVLETLGMSTQDRWRNVGFMAVYVVFNIAATFFIYWAVRVPPQKQNKKRI